VKVQAVLNEQSPPHPLPADLCSPWDFDLSGT